MMREVGRSPAALLIGIWFLTQLVSLGRFACRTIVKTRDYVFTDYGSR